MRALIAAAATALLSMTSAGATEQPKGSTFPAFSQDLLHIPNSGVTSGPGTITIHRGPGGKVTDITIQDSASGLVVNTGSTNVAAGFVADPLSRFAFGSNGWAIASYLDYSSFGVWITSGAHGIQQMAGAFAGGRATPLHVMPTTGTATYQGQTFGLGVESVPGVQLPIFISGDASITADFAHGQVATNLTNLMTSSMAPGGPTNPGPPTPLGALSGTASLTGNAYNGTLSGNLAVFSNTVPVAGPIQGTFFGPKTQETGGTWSISGSTTLPTPAGIVATGSFGAVKR